MNSLGILLIKAIFIGLATGILIAIPIGPSGIESIRWTITKGFRQGILVAVGSLIADTLDVILINFGLLNWIETNKLLEVFFWLLSGSITFFIGYRTLRNNKIYDSEKEKELLKKKEIKNHPVFTGFIINTTYPMTHFSWLAFSTTFIRFWRNTGKTSYMMFLVSMLCGIFICLTGMNFLASKGKSVVNEKRSQKFADFLAYGIAGLGAAFFIFGLFRLYLIIK